MKLEVIHHKSKMVPSVGKPTSAKEAHFTVLGFTAAIGEPITCAINFTAKTMKEEWALGYDHFTNWIRNEEDISKNIRMTK
jgi:hypothetical protein